MSYLCHQMSYLWLKCTKFEFDAGGAYSVPRSWTCNPTSPTSRGGREEGKGAEGRGSERRERERGKLEGKRRERGP